MAVLRLGLCLLLIAAVYGKHEKYEGHELYRVSGSAEDIAILERSLDVLAATNARSTSRTVDALVRISPEQKRQWIGFFEEKSISYTNIVENLAELLRSEESDILTKKETAKSSGRSISWDTYYRHQEINDYLDELASENPGLVTVINAALSYEGRQIKYVRISTTSFEDLRKPLVIVDASISGREWVTTPVALYIISQLVEDQSGQLASEIDWIIIPVVNPDGYEYAFEEDRLWYKTRSRSHANSDACPGVDATRNFAHEWGTDSASSLPCSTHYGGPSAFSEAETRMLQSVIMQNLNRASAYISLQSYGSQILYSWGNNGTLPSNGLYLHLIGVSMAGAMDAEALEGASPYTVGNAASAGEGHTGSPRDWVKAVGVPLTYTIKLPGYEYGYLVPTEYIQQIVEETWKGLQVAADFVLSP